MYAYDCAQLQHTAQHRTVLVTSPLTSRQASYRSSDVVYVPNGCCTSAVYFITDHIVTCMQL